jgi:polysaccharide deacetylase 2 family uncharacterized protein YibQ
MGRSKRKRRRRWVGYTLFFLLGSFLGIGGFLLLTREKPHPPPLPFERVTLIDQLIEGHFFEVGLTKKDILLHRSTREQSQWKIKLPRSVPYSLVEGKLRQSLTGLDPSLSIHTSSTGETFRMEIKVQDRTTHHLTFLLLPPPSKEKVRPKMAIVIDDLGSDEEIAREIFQLNLPITFSILPFTSHSKSIAKEAHRKGREIILHLPMEPHGYPQNQPGEGVLLSEMDESALLRQLSKDIEAVPYIGGVSNHMGSRLMEDQEKLKILLSDLKGRGLFFLDSRTTPQTLGFQTAKVLGLRSAERTVFLDHTLDENSIKQKIDELIQHALSTGRAIGIGHPHPSTVKSLKEAIPRIKEKGIEVVPLSSLME